MNFLELTSYIDEEQGYDGFPDFTDDVWPLLTRKAEEIEGLFLFHSSRGVGWAGHYEVVMGRIVRLKSLNELTKDELGKIEHWSFYGGHLNVLFRVSSESSLLRELCNFYPSVNLSSDDVDQLALKQESLAELRAFTAALPQELVFFSFAHDADPLYVFGHLETLRVLLRTVYATSQRLK